MTRRADILDQMGRAAPIERAAQKSRRVHHAMDKLYHGPLRIDAATVQAAAHAELYKTTHYHVVLRHVDEHGHAYLWRCAPVGGVAGDYLAEVVRTPEGEIRVHVYRDIVMSRPWREDLGPRTVASIVARYAPDPTIPQVTLEQERAHFLDAAPEVGAVRDGRLMPPVVQPSIPSWRRMEECSR